MATVSEIREWAIAQHGSQKYGHEPYSVHIDEVAEIGKLYLVDNKIIHDLLLDMITGNIHEHVQKVLYCHDILEDVEGMVFEMLARKVGIPVALDVENVTDAKGKNRKERKLRTWHKIRRSRTATFVKLCDRLANTRHPGDPEIRQMYRKEFPLFEAALYVPDVFERVWDDLRQATFG